MRCFGEVLFEHLHQARFTNARLSAQQHYLPGSLLGPLPTVQQEFHLLLPSYQRSQTRGGRYFQTAPCAALVEDPIDLHGGRKSLQAVKAEVLAGEKSLG